MTEDLGFTCKTYDACPNDCMLFWGEDEGRDTCEICEASRYNEGSKKIAIKRMRYFPLKPRLQKLFMSSKTASLMKWHAQERIDDGTFRHPADSQAWKEFDEKNPVFASDVRNVRLGLAADGFNPYGRLSVAHSTWPVVLMVYNLPPWLCMKQPFFLLSVLVPGPKGPGNKIDVYLQPLIEELKELFSVGVQTYDVSTGQMFSLKAALLWTISDIPAYAMLSGWSTRGEKACPRCGWDTRSCWLKHGRKFCYTGHRRFLPKNDRMRRDKTSFDGKMDWGEAPKLLSGLDMLEQLDGVLTEYKKEDLKKRRMGNLNGDKHQFWKKKSIFFELSYWATNLVPHNLDVMHIEGNYCDNLMGTIMNLAGKSKDNLNSRKDLEEFGLRKPLHPIKHGSGLMLPFASFTLSRADKDIFCKILRDMKLPDGYGSNMSRHVHDRRISGLKTHDNHMLMQQLLPIAIRRILPKNVVKVLIEISNFFRQLCSKLNNKYELEKIQDRIAVTLCHMEKIFPPSFFDIMEHLPIHLANEALMAGAVQFRWMYPIERYLSTLKRYVHNRARPEGSIAKGYLTEECLNFCSRYLKDVETKGNRSPRKYDVDARGGRPLLGKKVCLDRITWTQAHRYMLGNLDIIEPYRVIHMSIVASNYPCASSKQIQRLHNETFHEWFKTYVEDLRQNSTQSISEEIKILAAGPNQWARSYKVCVVNGFRFRTKAYDSSKTTQNSGVMCKASTTSYASVKDKNPRLGEVTYYGVLTDIFKIHYTENMEYLLFKCDWVDNEKGCKQDEFKFTLVNFEHVMYRDNLPTDEPFILSTQAEQVWYVPDPLEPSWKVVARMTRRDNFDVYSRDPRIEPIFPQELDDRPLGDNGGGDWVRQEVEGTIVIDETIIVEDAQVEDIEKDPLNCS